MSFDPNFVELTADVLKIYLQEKVRHRKSVVQYAAPCLWYVVEKTGFTTKRCASATFHHLFYALWLAVNLEHYLIPMASPGCSNLRTYEYDTKIFVF